MTDPGTLLDAQPIDTSIAGAHAWRIRYTSRDANGVAQESTGLVIAPVGDGAARPILSWCHGTTGLGDAACPSAQTDPACELSLYFTAGATAQIDYGVPGLQGFIDDGWVVCATDYQGLGTPGMHQYNVNRTNALDALYIAHAARRLDIGAGMVLASVGWSLGRCGDRRAGRVRAHRVRRPDTGRFGRDVPVGEPDRPGESPGAQRGTA